MVPGVTFENVVLTVDGEYVTSVFTMRWDGNRETAGIEVFRVEDGLITETWTAELGTGPWR